MRLDRVKGGQLGRGGCAISGGTSRPIRLSRTSELTASCEKAATIP